MREILFRGKRVDNGEWVYGFLDKIPDPKGFNMTVSPWWIHVPPKDPEDVIHTYSVVWYDQFTGLTDKNGKKIFEGDILKIARKSDGIGTYYIPPLDYPVNVAVKWDLTGWTWETLCKDKYYIHFPDAWCHFECEIIGNIHDNPELLKEDTYEENSDTV